ESRRRCDETDRPELFVVDVDEHVPLAELGVAHRVADGVGGGGWGLLVGGGVCGFLAWACSRPRYQRANDLPSSGGACSCSGLISLFGEEILPAEDFSDVGPDFRATRSRMQHAPFAIRAAEPSPDLEVADHMQIRVSRGAFRGLGVAVMSGSHATVT